MRSPMVRSVSVLIFLYHARPYHPSSRRAIRLSESLMSRFSSRRRRLMMANPAKYRSIRIVSRKSRSFIGLTFEKMGQASAKRNLPLGDEGCLDAPFQIVVWLVSRRSATTQDRRRARILHSAFEVRKFSSSFRKHSSLAVCRRCWYSARHPQLGVEVSETSEA